MSTTLAQLKADVLTLVKRADLVNDIDLHTKNAILKVHTSDYYLKDLFESAFSFAVADVNYSLEVRSLIPRYRKMKYLNTVDATTRDIISRLTPIEVTNFLDAYSYKKDYVFYEAGDMIQIRVSDQPQYFGIGCYLYPDTTLVNPSWIADQVPAAIHYEAARTLFKAIGADEQSASMDKLAADAMRQVMTIGIPTIGE